MCLFREENRETTVIKFNEYFAIGNPHTMETTESPHLLTHIQGQYSQKLLIRETKPRSTIEDTKEVDIAQLSTLL